MNINIESYSYQKHNWTFTAFPVIIFDRRENEYSVLIGIFFWAICFELIK